MKNTRQAIEQFLQSKTLAVVGVSHSSEKFGNYLYKEIKKAGYKVYAVNPALDMIDGERCYAGLGALPEKADGVVIVVQPRAVLAVLDEAAVQGIKQVWLQQGADSPEAEEKAQSLGLSIVSGECLMMFMEPVQSIHKFHRGFKKIFGKLPR